MAVISGRLPVSWQRAFLLGLSSISASGCFVFSGSEGGGEVMTPASHTLSRGDVALAAGYEIDVIANHLTFPTSVTFDDRGDVYVTEAGYSYGDVFTVPRLLRLREGDAPEVVASGNNGPWTGVTFHGGAFYLAEGGQLQGGRILKIARNGDVTTLVEGLPSLGDHHTNGPVVGDDGFVYFGQGTATNSAVVGTDNADFGWLARHPDFHDIPCHDIKLTGANFESANPLTSDPDDRVSTGAFSKLGHETTPGEVIAGQLPCNGAVMRVPLLGGPVELVAWGFRNPFGLAFGLDKALYVTDNGYDDRGSRPVFGAADVLWRVQPGAWYGWPELAEGRPIYQDEAWGDHYRVPGKATPPRLLAEAPGKPPEPSALFPVHASADGFDFSRSAEFGFVGEAFVALFGDQSPTVGKTLGPVGFKVVRVNVKTGVISDFAVNRTQHAGPASKVRGGGLERPLAVRFDPSGGSLYVVDFGVLTVNEKETKPRPGTGTIWRITRTGQRR
jgi:glucose/arabinose dehydrogenase